MEGGIAILLLVIVGAIVAIVVVAMYVTGGAVGIGRQREKRNHGREGGRPTHKAPRDPAQEHVHLFGTPEGDAAARRQRDRN